MSKIESSSIRPPKWPKHDLYDEFRQEKVVPAKKRSLKTKQAKAKNVKCAKSSLKKNSAKRRLFDKSILEQLKGADDVSTDSSVTNDSDETRFSRGRTAVA